MFFKQLPSKESTLSYLFGCGGFGKAVAVDVVAGDEEWFVDQAQQAKVAITHVIDTHLHADHYSGGSRLAQQMGAHYCLHEHNRAQVKFDFFPLQDHDIIPVGNVVIQVVHTPGHTLDSVCLLVTDKRRGEEPWFIITGDTLFVGGVGRPDLAGKEREMAGMLYDSLHTRILTLPDTVEIFPGHQAGSLCGASLSGKPSSTIGFERRFNTGLRIPHRDEFIQFLTAEIPPQPPQMAQIVAANCENSR